MSGSVGGWRGLNPRHPTRSGLAITRGVRDDWEVLTATLTTQMLHIDPTASQDVSWVYLVNAVDAAGNGGPLVCVGIPAEATEP